MEKSLKHLPWLTVGQPSVALTFTLFEEWSGLYKDWENPLRLEMLRFLLRLPWNPWTFFLNHDSSSLTLDSSFYFFHSSSLTLDSSFYFFDSSSLTLDLSFHFFDSSSLTLDLSFHFFLTHPVLHWLISADSLLHLVLYKPEVPTLYSLS